MFCVVVCVSCSVCHVLCHVLCVVQQCLTGGDYDDVEDLEQKLESYKSNSL